MTRTAFLTALTFAFALPAATAFAGCAQDIATFQKLLDGDLKTGFVAKSVYAAASSELTEAKSLCSAGQADAASAAVRASRSRHGYPN